MQPGRTMTEICERIENGTRALIKENGLQAGVWIGQGCGSAGGGGLPGFRSSAIWHVLSLRDMCGDSRLDCGARARHWNL
jgi:hypothetical protein